MDFDEFRVFFPRVKSRKQQCHERRNRASAKQDICETQYEIFAAKLNTWLNTIETLKKKFEATRLDVVNGKVDVKRLEELMVSIGKEIKYPPKAAIDYETEQALWKTDDSEKSKGKRRRSKEGFKEFGVTQLAEFLEHQKENWKKSFSQSSSQLEGVK